MLKFYFPWIIHRPHDGGPKHRWLCVRFNGINWIFEKIEKKILDRTKSTQTRKFYWIQRRHIFGFSQLLLIFNWLRLHSIFNFPFQNIHFNRYDYLFCWFFPIFFSFTHFFVFNNCCRSCKTAISISTINNRIVLFTAFQSNNWENKRNKTILRQIDD